MDSGQNAEKGSHYGKNPKQQNAPEQVNAKTVWRIEEADSDRNGQTQDNDAGSDSCPVVVDEANRAAICVTQLDYASHVKIRTMLVNKS